jgi:hypothetical protein
MEVFEMFFWLDPFQTSGSLIFVLDLDYLEFGIYEANLPFVLVKVLHLVGKQAQLQS